MFEYNAVLSYAELLKSKDLDILLELKLSKSLKSSDIRISRAGNVSL